MALAIDRLLELDAEASERQQDRAIYLSLMESVIEALPDALIVADSHGKIVLVNEKAEFMFGYARAEMIGQSVERLLPERNRGRHSRDRQMYSRFDISQRSRNMGIGENLPALHRDGHEFPTDITLARMVGAKGVFNLAMIRFSTRAMEIVAAQDHADPGQPPEAELLTDDLNAGR